MRTLAEINAELAEVERSRQRARAVQASEEARQAEVQRSKEQIEADRIELIAAQRASLAQDLNLDVDTATVALAARRNTTTGDTKHLFVPLFRLWNESCLDAWREDAPAPAIAREARHCLAAMEVLPPVRRGDAAFGTEAEIRRVPSPSLEAGSTLADTRYHAIVAALGLTLPREREPSVESPKAARNRLGPKPLTYGMAAMFAGAPVARDANSGLAGANWPTRKEHAEREREAAISAKVESANEMYHRELSLIEERWRAALSECRAEHKRVLVAQRTQIVDAIDRTLAGLPIGEAWWWSRQLRRVAAGERCVRIADGHSSGFDISIEKIFHLARAAGARFDLNGSTPSKKK